MHFTAMPEYADRVKQLGENPTRVFSVGETGLDTIKQIQTSKADLERELDISLATRNFLVTLHPETNTGTNNKAMAENLVAALDSVDDAMMIFTKANSDPGHQAINEVMKRYCDDNPGKAKLFASLGRQRYISLARYCNAVIGNSSSGIVEVPSLGVPSINIGDRQKGRISAASVIHCGNSSVEISKAISLAMSNDFCDKARNVINPYGDGNSCRKIVDAIKSIDLKHLAPKKFFDLE
jgi:UDP-N-acetylglucosamine 2-epimerase (non-hydrolysing)